MPRKWRQFPVTNGGHFSSVVAAMRASSFSAEHQVPERKGLNG